MIAYFKCLFVNSYACTVILKILTSIGYIFVDTISTKDGAIRREQSSADERT